MSWGIVLSFALGLALLYAIGRLLLVPMRLLWRLLAGAVLGALALWLLNQFGGLVGLSGAPVNPLTALVTGVLGIPGAALVIALSYLL